MSDPIYVAFATQKGGVGKSTLTALVASYLYYVEGIEVAAVDCDSTQHSLNVYREHDLMVTKENPYLKRVCHKFYSQFKQKPYEILLTSPADAIAVTDNFLKAGNTPMDIFFYTVAYIHLTLRTIFLVQAHMSLVGSKGRLCRVSCTNEDWS